MDIKIILGKEYIYKRDKRVVKVVQINEKTRRVEVICGEWNPFWINFSELENKNL